MKVIVLAEIFEDSNVDNLPQKNWGVPHEFFTEACRKPLF